MNCKLIQAFKYWLQRGMVYSLLSGLTKRISTGTHLWNGLRRLRRSSSAWWHVRQICILDRSICKGAELWKAHDAFLWLECKAHGGRWWGMKRRVERGQITLASSRYFILKATENGCRFGGIIKMRVLEIDFWYWKWITRGYRKAAKSCSST